MKVFHSEHGAAWTTTRKMLHLAACQVFAPSNLGGGGLPFGAFVVTLFGFVLSRA